MTKKNRTKESSLIVLVGRVNVGKSTLFNTLIEEKKAVASPIPGTTRDVCYGQGTWRGKGFTVVDTGGFVQRPENEIEEQITKHAQRMIKEASVILFVVDSRTGFNPEDRAYFKLLRKLSKAPVVYVANKADSPSLILGTSEKEWLSLGIGAPTPVSAVTGRGVGDLLDDIYEKIGQTDTQEQSEQPPIRVAIVGRTNVGKSSIVNRMLGEERVIVSSIPHTTREPQDTALEFESRQFILVDTVGMRKKTKVRSSLEREGLIRSIQAIKRADVVVLVLESNVTPSKQESRLARIAVDSGAGLVIVINKWDLIEEKQSISSSVYEQFFRKELAFVSWAPMVFISALSGQRTSKILEYVGAVESEREREITQDDLTAFIKRSISKQPPQWMRNKKKPVIYGFSQAGTCPPKFSLSVKDSTGISYAYLRYLENNLRALYGFSGTPVMIYSEMRV